MRWVYILVAAAGFFFGLALMAQDPPASNTPLVIHQAAYLPAWYGSVGGGAVIPGKSKFAYQAVAAFIGQASYLTAVTEYTLAGGQVQSCTLGSVSKVLYGFHALSIGTTGLGGGCSTAPDSGGAAAAVQGFLSYRLGKTGISLLATGDKTFTQDGKQAAKLTFGVSYGK